MKFGYECNGCEGCELLHDSQEKIRAVFESSVDCILVWDRDYNYLYANQVAIDHVGVVMLQTEMDKSLKVVNLLWISMKGICYEKGTQTV